MVILFEAPFDGDIKGIKEPRHITRFDVLYDPSIRVCTRASIADFAGFSVDNELGCWFSEDVLISLTRHGNLAGSDVRMVKACRT